MLQGWIVRNFIAFERRRLEADAQVAQAKGQRFQMDLNASFGLNSAAATFDESYQNAQTQQFANLTLNIPIVNWGRNEARMKTVIANKQSDRLCDCAGRAKLRAGDHYASTAIGSITAADRNLQEIG